MVYISAAASDLWVGLWRCFDNIGAPVSDAALTVAAAGSSQRSAYRVLLRMQVVGHTYWQGLGQCTYVSNAHHLLTAWSASCSAAIL